MEVAYIPVQARSYIYTYYIVLHRTSFGGKFRTHLNVKVTREKDAIHVQEHVVFFSCVSLTPTNGYVNKTCLSHFEGVAR